MEIDRALRTAGCVLVVWSRHSVDSQWVQAEAAVGCSCKTLLPVRIDDTPLRVPFQLLQTLDLSAGNGAFSAAQLAQLRTAVRVHVEPVAGPATAASPSLAPPLANEDDGPVDAFLHPQGPEASRVLAQANGVPPVTEHVVMQLAGMYGWTNGVDITAAQSDRPRAATRRGLARRQYVWHRGGPEGVRGGPGGPDPIGTRTRGVRLDED